MLKKLTFKYLLHVIFTVLHITWSLYLFTTDTLCYKECPQHISDSLNTNTNRGRVTGILVMY
jgi:hypothetical protein